MISGVLLFKIFNFKYSVNLKAVNWSFLVENSYKILNFSWNLHNELLMSIFFWSSPLWSSAIIEYVPKSISSKRNIVNKGLSNLGKNYFQQTELGWTFSETFENPSERDYFQRPRGDRAWPELRLSATKLHSVCRILLPLKGFCRSMNFNSE